MHSRKKLKWFLVLSIFAIGALIFNLYSYPSPDSVKNEIQNYLEVEYGRIFSIKEITVHRSPDLFHQPDCYNLTLVDISGLEINNIKIEYNKVQKRWTTCYGTDIKKEYKKALSEKRKYIE
ncbi:MAG: hypothetical protein JST81_06960 [Bacteroidetes bacterium]|jgi:hypothetical protein|nr:hypothetical protein [Bacteroidota bacterium]